MAPVLKPAKAQAWADTMNADDLREIASRRPIPTERWQSDGFPPPLDVRRRRRRRALVLAVVVLAMVLASAVVMNLPSNDRVATAPRSSPSALISSGRDVASKTI